MTDALEEFFKERGWTYNRKQREHNNTYSVTRCAWYKYFRSRYKCRTNAEKPGIQIAVSGTHYSGHAAMYEIDICGETRAGYWVDFKYYSLTDAQLVQNYDKFIAGLLTSWEAANAAVM